MPTPPKTCEHCQHFGHPVGGRDGDGEWGYCHRFPPVPTTIDINDHGQNMNNDPIYSLTVRSEWPTVNPHDWCGEWLGTQFVSSSYRRIP
jgi:hypothetical protein